MRFLITLFYLAFLTVAPTLWISTQSSMVEICDNGIDDDMDGLIDINDSDCQCTPIVPSGLIPNPSFENRTCCPQIKARLDCADNWIQASAATTDYINTCGFLGNVIDVPLPIADGEGAIGLRDGSTQDGNYKEYAGACLSEPLETGKSYRLRLNVGFRTAVTSPSFRLSIFGHPSCDNLPFGNGNASIGCPSNTPGWLLLGEVFVSGNDEWIETEINFRPTQNISAVAIGPDCSIRDQSADRYYFFDNLRLAETIDFGYQVNVEGGNPCQSDFSLSLSGSEPNESYQWYRNGIAISGATQPAYIVPNDASREAEYQVRIEDASGCQLTDVYAVEINETNSSKVDFACANSTYTFGTQQLTSSGMYTETFLDTEGCDSTVSLQLTFRDENRNNIDTTICRGEVFILGNERIVDAGNYMMTLTDQVGCDSTINLSLAVKDPAASFNFQDQAIELGDEFLLDLQNQSMNLQSFTWSSNIGEICSDCPSQVIAPFQNTTYTLDVLDNNNCNVVSVFELTVNKNYQLFIPNVFSPNSDGINDFFSIYPSKSLANVNYFRVFDRWGNFLFETLNTMDIEWDGSYKGKQLNINNFVYVAEVVFIDGHTKTISGSVQIIR